MRFRRTVNQIDLGSGGLGVAFMMVVAFNADLLIRLTMGAQFILTGSDHSYMLAEANRRSAFFRKLEADRKAS